MSCQLRSGAFERLVSAFQSKVFGALTSKDPKVLAKNADIDYLGKSSGICSFIRLRFETIELHQFPKETIDRPSI